MSTQTSLLGQTLNINNVNNTSGSDFMSPNTLLQTSMTNNPLLSLARNQSVLQLNSIGQAIERSLFELGSSTSGSNPGDEKSNLINEYNALSLQVRQYTAVAPSLEIGVLNDKIAEMRGKMIKFDERKRVLVSGNNSVFASTTGAIHYYLVWILYILGPIVSSMILLNALCFNKSSRVPEQTSLTAGPFIVYKLFYVCLAILFYPLFLLYGGINPPVFTGWFPIFAMPDNEESGIFNYIIGYKKPNPATDNPIKLERGRVLLRALSLILFLMFMYTFVFFDEIGPLSL